jgi:hypothetical protein
VPVADTFSESDVLDDKTMMTATKTIIEIENITLSNIFQDGNIFSVLLPSVLALESEFF